MNGHLDAKPRPQSVAPALFAVAALWWAGGTLPAQTDDCSTDAAARTVNDQVSQDMSTLIAEVRAFDENLEAALDAKAKEAAWSEAQVAAFRRQLVEDPQFQVLKSQRDKESRSLVLSSLGMVGNLGKDPIALCRSSTGVRANLARLRAVLDREYALIRDRIWGSP